MFYRKWKIVVRKLMGALEVFCLLAACSEERNKQSSFADCQQVAAGDYHSCCLHVDGNVSCWGASHA